MKNTYKDAAMEFSRCARTDVRRASRSRLVAGLSKLNSVGYVEVDVVLGELGHRTMP